MSNQRLPGNYRWMFKVETVDEMWHKLLTEGDPMSNRFRRIFGLIPTNPRCAACYAPFAGIGGAIAHLGLFISRPSTKNPRFCTACDAFNVKFPGGAGIHTGPAWVGSIAGASGATADFTALGDHVNIAARLASKAGAGEVLISEAAYHAAQLKDEGLEKRDLELKGRNELVSVRVLK
jgi:hypothetical protein